MPEKLYSFQISFPKEAADALISLSKGNGITASQVATKKICDHFGVPYEIKLCKRLEPSESLSAERIEKIRAVGVESDKRNKVARRKRDLARMRGNKDRTLNLLVTIGERPKTIFEQTSPDGKRNLLSKHPKWIDGLPPEKRDKELEKIYSARRKDRLKLEEESSAKNAIEKAFEEEEKTMRVGYSIVGIGSDKCCAECKFFLDGMCNKFDVASELGGTCASFEPYLES